MGRVSQGVVKVNEAEVGKEENHVKADEGSEKYRERRKLDGGVANERKFEKGRSER